jgi:pyruvate dehydrogenase E2 component (dihydrolipoamide acetyltransferase)
MAEFRMPSLGADMESGKLVEWRIKPGDAVHRGDIVAVVDTDKADIEVEVFEDGIVNELLVPVGERVLVGTPLATIWTNGRPERPPPLPPVAEPEVLAPTPSTAAAPAPPAPSPAGARRRVSPLARRVAEALGVDLGSIEGSGPGGAVTRQDVERAASVQPPSAAPAPAPAPAPTKPTSTEERREAMRHAIGALMARSKREIPHYYLETHIDMTNALGWLQEQNLTRPVEQRLVPAALLLKAAALAAHEVPGFNGFWLDEGFKPSKTVHLGVAVSLRQGGLIAPALHDADAKTVDELMAAMRDLVQRARRGSLRASEMSDPTITVTNLGEHGVETVFGVIYPPQVALVGFGKIAERPWAVEGMLGVRQVLTATLSADHRASDGHQGGLFLAAIERLLQEPGRL